MFTRAPGTLLLAAILGTACADPPIAATARNPRPGQAPTQAARQTSATDPLASAGGTGAEVYAQHCAVCHGDDGRGDGEAAHRFTVKPRNFVEAEYRFRSTASGKLPTDDDLRRAIVGGLGGTAMIPQGHLSPGDVSAVIEFIKTLSPRFATGPMPVILRLPAEVALGPASLGRGRAVFAEAGCDGCHGDRGKGDGRNAGDLSQAPTDLTRQPLKGGSTAADILRSVITGLNGTPMPSYHLLYDPPDMWALAYYVESLGVPGGMTEQERLGWEVEKRAPPD